MKTAILTYSHANLFELGCMVELFCKPPPSINDWYETEVVTFDPNELIHAGGLKMIAKSITSLESYDMLLVPSWHVGKPAVDPLLAAQIEKFHQKKKRIVSFCSGAFLLGEIGLLNHRNATTHWRFAEIFKRNYPKIRYVDDVLYIYDGLIGCSAGSAAALDLGIEIIRRDHGYKIANHFAKQLVMSAHRSGGQSQYVETPLLKTPNRFAEAIQWSISHLNTGFSINQWAETARMSRRTFDRKFRSTFNMSPQLWLIKQKILLAKEHLESGTHSIEVVAELSGFSNATTMRHHFRKQLQISPQQYQKQFHK